MPILHRCRVCKRFKDTNDNFKMYNHGILLGSTLILTYRLYNNLGFKNIIPFIKREPEICLRHIIFFGGLFWLTGYFGSFVFDCLCDCEKKYPRY